MPEDWRTLIALIVVFGPLSLFSIGGGASLLAEIENQSVAVHHWTTHREFADLFAISRAAPGPGTMLSTLIGWKVAGWAGALTATVALYLPSSLLVFGVSRLWGRWRGSPWHGAIERGLAPIAAGLVLAGGLAVLQAAGGAAVWAAAAVATAILLRWPRLNPLILFGVSGVLFAAATAFGPM
jgi:chromate transporter